MKRCNKAAGSEGKGLRQGGCFIAQGGGTGNDPKDTCDIRDVPLLREEYTAGTLRDFKTKKVAERT